MPKIIKGLLIAILCTGLSALTLVLIDLATGKHVSLGVVAVVGLILGLLYGLEAGILLIYDLDQPDGWAKLVVDMTWSLPNTLFGFLVGNPIYLFIGWPSRAESEGAGWVVYLPRSAGGTGFGHTVLQTLGTINLGGAGNHEKVHLLQARIFGPFYLPIFGLNYAINFLIQCFWTISLGGLLSLLKARERAYFRPPSNSAVGGFFGWIYYATLFELWAYGTEP